MNGVMSDGFFLPHSLTAARLAGPARTRRLILRKSRRPHTPGRRIARRRGLANKRFPSLWTRNALRAATIDVLFLN